MFGPTLLPRVEVRPISSERVQIGHRRGDGRAKEERGVAAGHGGSGPERAAGEQSVWTPTPDMMR